MIDLDPGLGGYLRMMAFFVVTVAAGFLLKRVARGLTTGHAAGAGSAQAAETTASQATLRPLKAGIAQKLKAFAGFQILLLTLAYWTWIGFATFLVILFAYSLMEIRALRVSTGYPAGYGFRPLPAYGILVLFALAIVGYLFAASSDPMRGNPVLAFLFLLVAIFDGYSQIWGEILRGPKITPRTSPGKTWSGFLCGLACCAAAACAGSLLVFPTPFPPATPPDGIGRLLQSTIEIGLGVGALAFLGDISASWVKRRLGIKDFSALLGAQGGMLDRADSLLWLGPAYFIAVRYCHPFQY